MNNQPISNDNDIMDLTNQLIEAHEIIEKQKITINDLKAKLNISNENINNYKNIIDTKELELNKLKSQLNNINKNNNINKKLYQKELMCVNFISTDQNVRYAVPCTKNNIFAEVEEKLYQQYPEYRNTNNNFIANGTQVLRFKTISENKIGNGFPVTLVIPA